MGKVVALSILGALLIWLPPAKSELLIAGSNCIDHYAALQPGQCPISTELRGDCVAAETDEWHWFAENAGYNSLPECGLPFFPSSPGWCTKESSAWAALISHTRHDATCGQAELMFEGARLGHAILGKYYFLGCNYYVTWQERINGNCTEISQNGDSQAERSVTCPVGYQPYGPSGSCFRIKPEACTVDNPIQCAGGQKQQTEIDIAPSQGSLGLTRYYSSIGFYTSPGVERSREVLGTRWRHSWQSSVVVEAASTPGGGSYAYVILPNGDYLQFHQSGAMWLGRKDKPDTLTELTNNGARTGWQFKAADDSVYTFDAAGIWTSLDKHGLVTSLHYSDSSTPADVAPKPGLLTDVTDPRGHALKFYYDDAAYLIRVAEASGATTGYRFATRVIAGLTENQGLLQFVDRPDSTTRHYLYDEPAHVAPNLPYHELLTGIVDENGLRFATFEYDTGGRAVHEWHGSGSADATNYAYDAGGYNGLTSSTIRQTKSGAFEKRKFVAAVGIVRDAGVDQCNDSTCSTVTASSSRTYDANGNPDLDTDFNHHVIDHDYDTRGLETQRVESVGTPSQRTTNTQWNPTFNVRDQRTVKNASGATESLTKWVYNPRGQPTARCEVDPAIGSATSYTCGSATSAPVGVRQTRTTYCEPSNVAAGTCPLVGLVTSVNGPRAMSDAGMASGDDITTYTYYQTDDATCASGGACPHRKGDLWKVTNALGHVTETVSYDGNGRVTRSKDANGTLTDFAYHPRGWLTDRIVRANADGSASANDATLHIDYDPVGNVVKVTQPDGDFLAYTYDDAHRLIKIADNAGDTIDYCPGGVGSAQCLDAAGNRRIEQVKDASGAIKRQLHRVYNQLGQLTQQLNAANDPVESSMGLSENLAGQPAVADGYDGNGNRVLSDDGLGTRTKQQYDGLNRLVATIQDYNGIDTATANTTTQYIYDARDNLRQVTDPDDLNTVYDYDGLNNLTGLHSPDTGNASYTYDKAGNRLTQTDARGVTSTYTYDALNRLTAIAYPTSSLNVSYAYDQSNTTTGCAQSYPVGRLTKMTDPTGSTTYCYDRHGNVTKKTQVGTRIFSCLSGTSGCGGSTPSFAAGIGADPGGIANPTKSTAITLVTTMAYTKGDRIQSIAYPSGAIITYGRDMLGRITSVQYKANASVRSVNLIGSATYYPFGPLRTLTWGNGRTLTKTYDADYAIDSVQANPSGLTLDATTDVMGNVTALSQTLSSAWPDRSYQYDALYRLSKAKAGTTTRESYTYSPTGDRTSATLDGATQAYTYTAGTHHLASVGATARSYDANGNTTSNNLAYDQRNRLSGWKLQGGQIDLGGDSAQYGYNGKGERTVKQVTYNDHCLAPACYPGPGAPTGWLTGTAAFAYDEAGHLIGEYPSLYGPGKNTEYIYLDGTPIAAIRSGQVHEIETDHLGTPRSIVKPGATPGSDVTVWRWDLLGNTFGTDAPNEDADGDGTAFTFNLRYPGQYADAETGLNYNYFRDYEPGVGRYIESDPIGMTNRSPSTYAYVAANPLKYVDTSGLYAEMCTRVFYPIPIPYARHCLLRFNGNNSDTSSFDPDGTHPDPAPDWWPKTCQATQGDPNDDCLKRQMEICKAEDYDFTGNNCCHCVENALKACGISIPKDSWPNWPINPGPQPGEPGYILGR